MRKIVLVLLVAAMLAACQSAATPRPAATPPTTAPTSTPVERLASSASDIQGLWWFNVKLRFKPDGAYVIYFGSDSNPDLIDLGTYTFDAGKVTFNTTGYAPTTYEAYVTWRDGSPTWIRLQAVSSDAYADRANSFSRPGQYLKP